ncbi:hypothetical protein [Streptomyces leeuwenhoekii]|uniref:hypothetical protein n=1 Tax=Streptomyces leeuwenhoekii TaxID=1437453 RepID=UPI000AE695D3|nr:hypothetical protein [Streptomyces leeuwenhoekii]
MRTRRHGRAARPRNQWKRDGTSISGATTSTYVLAKADKGRKTTVKVTAHRRGWTSGSATTAPVTVR